jgi:hypothetical protein
VYITGAEGQVDPKFTNPNTSGLSIEIDGRINTFDIVVDKP